ncbi:hypothetical protein [Sansalvadorimonas verongulae]|uniref:hypothetical protein n=1 Tax=Sansalvadorimonas verongulae TaxID=2172824 RepID=UPI0012BB9F36|nr:hypothetical protein [Sansalvadorimonas verongulae]MTI14940.1 hypothetical protein [Sansalvadorimonas verongulae]
MMKQFLFLPALALLLLTGCQTAPQPVKTSLHTPTGPVVAGIEADIAANRLTRPTGHNALEKIQRLELISPHSPAIGTYREQVAQQLVALGQKAFIQQKYDRAKLLAVRALKVLPDYPEAGFILDAVREAQKPTSRPRRETMTVEIEEVASSPSVGVITVTVPELQGTIEE